MEQPNEKMKGNKKSWKRKIEKRRGKEAGRKIRWGEKSIKMVNET